VLGLAACSNLQQLLPDVLHTDWWPTTTCLLLVNLHWLCTQLLLLLLGGSCKQLRRLWQYTRQALKV
jgi:hypothetical protein